MDERKFIYSAGMVKKRMHDDHQEAKDQIAFFTVRFGFSKCEKNVAREFGKSKFMFLSEPSKPPVGS
jgi:hypothetical protein